MNLSMETNESSPRAPRAEEILTPAASAAEAPDAAAEAAVEMEMTEAMEQEAADEAVAQSRPSTPEDVIAAACDVLAREAADIAGDDVRRLRSLWNALRPAAAADNAA